MESSRSGGVGGAPAPLEGVRVVELANYLSGPFTTLMLCDLGAEVVKVEPERGDPYRRIGRGGAPLSPLFVNANRGKQGITLDLKSEAGRERVFELLSGADVMVCNWRPGAAQRLGLDDDDLETLNPRLIRAYITGFGLEGPRAGEPTYDTIVQAHVGSADDTSAQTPPTIMGSYIVDKMTATLAAQAILAALYARERHGQGDRIDISLLDAAAYMAFPDIMANRTFVDGADRPARNRQIAAPRAIRAADGWLIVAPVTASQVRRAFDTVGAPETASSLLAMKDPAELTVRMLDELEERTRTAGVEHWLRAFADADVPAGACLTIDEHLADEQVQFNRLYSIVDVPDLGRVRIVRYPAVFESTGHLIPRGTTSLLGG